MLGSLAAILVVASSYRHHERAAGLAAEYYTGVAWAGPPVWRTVEAVPHQRPLWARTAELAIPHFSVRWRGYLSVPATTTYRFIARGKPAVLLIDGRPAADGASPFAGPPLRLNRGLHPIQIDFAYAHGPQDFRIAWATDTGPFVPLDRMLLSTEIIPGDIVRHRRLLYSSGRMMPLLLLACIVAACAVGVRHVVRRVFPRLPASKASRMILRLVLLAAAILFTAGSWWGEPAFVDWAPDEISPNDVLDAVRMRFVGGWASIYPPLQFALLAVFDAPFFFTGAIGLPSVDDVRVRGMVVVVNRLVSSAMAIGILFFIYRVAAEQWRPRTGIAAAAFAAGILPLAYYAKTSNVDVPYHFSLALALVFAMRAVRRGAPSDYYGFTIAGMAAVCTKDQAYGYLVLPALAIAWRAFVPRRDRSDLEPRPRTVLTMAGIVIASVLVFHLAALNPAGFVEHFRLITGPASQPFRTYAATLEGHALMARDAIWQLGPMLSWPVFAIAAGAVGWAAWRRERALLILLLPVVSYYLTFIAVIGYQYDRFFIGVALILCIFAGWAVDRIVPAGGPSRSAMLAAVSAVLAFAVWRVASLDALMIRDSRYAAEAWLRDNVGPGKTVAATGMSHYLPRHVMVGWDPIPASRESLRERTPDYIVLSAGFALREPDGSIGAEFYRALREGREGYTLKRVFRTPLPLSALALETRFREVRDDPQSNLSKVNPAIEIYGR